MQLRLAFAVAAFLEPEILIIDEVLAVGDAEFQKKCLGKMEDVSKSGRTILFVSHDLAAVEKLCPRTVLLKDGSVQMIETTEAAISTYLGEKLRVGGSKTFLTKNVMVSRFEFGKHQRIISKTPLSFDIELTCSDKQPLITEFCILIYTLRGYRAAIIDLRDYINAFEYLENKIYIRGVIEKMNFVEGEYQIGLYYSIDDVVGEIHDMMALTILDNSSTNIRKYAPQYRGTLELDFKVGGAHD
jgi:lipopolysaccharide transport system ATP-binding protein